MEVMASIKGVELLEEVKPLIPDSRLQAFQTKKFIKFIIRKK